MKLIIGLGNPSKEYLNNRHNVGHMVVDALQDLPKDTKAEKTTVYMNESGEEVKKLVNFYFGAKRRNKVLAKPGSYKVSLDELYVVYDDLDIPLGSYKISKGKSPRVHNGIISVIEKLGSEDFWHVRIGVDGRGGGREMSGKDYVLQNFSADEKEQLDKAIEEVVRLLCGSKE